MNQGIRNIFYYPNRFIAIFLRIMIRLYQLLLSPIQNGLSPVVGFRCGCRFLPTCSDYALQCLQKHPFHRACWLILKRLLRCQSLCKSGYDPIP